MSKIQVLDQITIDKIAAGEVIERPASVVKELAENAIDAGATAVTVEIKEGGITFMRIADNGIGIDKEDVRAAFLRHSTSKIRSAEDLAHHFISWFPWRSTFQYCSGLSGRASDQDKGSRIWRAI